MSRDCAHAAAAAVAAAAHQRGPLPSRPREEASLAAARTRTYRTLPLDPGISGASLVCPPPVPTSRLPEAANRLTDILRALPQGELDGLIERLAIRIDPAKRIDVPSQVARALVSLPDLRDATRLNPACLELMHRVAEARGSLLVASVPPGLEPLLARGLMFARASGISVELILPAAYLVQLKAWEGEDPRGMRALLSQAQFETMSAIASHYLGRPATPPLALSLESAWDVLGNPQKLAEEIAKLSPTERRVLEGVEAEGGEVPHDVHDLGMEQRLPPCQADAREPRAREQPQEEQEDIQDV